MHKSLIVTASSEMLNCLQAAASAFNILFKSGGGSAVESVIPTLLAGLEGSSEQASQALEGLRVILGVRPQTLGSMVGALFPDIKSALQSCATSVSQAQISVNVQVPKLLRPPLHSTNLHALAALAEVAGKLLGSHTM